MSTPSTTEVQYLTPEGREQLIAELVDRHAEITGRMRLEELLRAGWRGYAHYSDTELVAEAMKQGVDLPAGVTCLDLPQREYRVT